MYSAARVLQGTAKGYIASCLCKCNEEQDSMYLNKGCCPMAWTIYKCTQTWAGAHDTCHACIEAACSHILGTLCLSAGTYPRRMHACAHSITLHHPTSSLPREAVPARHWDMGISADA